MGVLEAPPNGRGFPAIKASVFYCAPYTRQRRGVRDALPVNSMLSFGRRDSIGKAARGCQWKRRGRPVASSENVTEGEVIWEYCSGSIVLDIKLAFPYISSAKKRPSERDHTPDGQGCCETANVRYDYRIGTMIDVTRAALTADQIAAAAEFFSFGVFRDYRDGFLP
jgi:hypothetical protein